MKTCSKCGAEKPLSEFNLSGGMRDGHRSECRDCQALVNRKRRNAIGWRGPVGRLPSGVRL